MPRPISATLLVSEFIPTLTPGEYTFTGGAFNNQTDETGNGALDVTANNFKLYVQATDVNTAAPMPGVVHRYKLTVATPISTNTLNGTMMWDEPGVPADSPTNGSYCALCQSAGQGLSMIPSTSMYANLPVGMDVQAMMLDTRDVISTGSIAPNLVGPVTSVGNATSIANGAITNAMLANAAVGNLSGSNTGDETLATIKTKLGVTTLSGSNTGDQVIPTTLPASDVYAWAKASTRPTYTAADVSALPSAGGALTGRVDLKTYTEAKPSVAYSANIVLDLSTGTCFDVTLTGNATFSFTNVPNVANTMYSFTLIVRQDATGSRIGTFPTNRPQGGTALALTTTASKADIISWMTPDGGTTWFTSIAKNY